MPIPPLKATRLQTSGEVAVLNRWADRVKQAIDDLKISVVKKQANINLKTDNVSNQTQDILNLKAGNNIELTTDPFGAVIISSTSAGDGLVHGDVIWEYDPAYIILRDDFIFGSGGGTNTIGELGWTTSGTSGVADRLFGPIPNSGAVQLYSSATTANTGAVMLYNGGGNVNTNFANVALPLLDYPGWKVTWVFCIRRPYNIDPTSTAFNITKSSMYIGLGLNWPNVFGTRPPVFIGCRYDTDTTAPSINDTTYVLEATFNSIAGTTSTRYNNQGTLGGTFNTGITPLEGVWHRLEISCAASGQIAVSLDGTGTTFSVTQQIATLGSGLLVSAGNGAITFQGTPSAFSNTNGYPGVAPGVIATTSGIVHNPPPPNLSIDNGTFTVAAVGANFQSWSTLGTGVGGTPTSSYTVTCYPALLPLAMYLNDSAGTAPASGSRCLAVDYFSLVWNKGGLATSNGTPDKTKSRYW